MLLLKNVGAEHAHAPNTDVRFGYGLLISSHGLNAGAVRYDQDQAVVSCGRR